MTNVYFSNEGMTSTTANFLANIAKELQSAATERLNNVKFYNTSVAVIGSSEKQIMSIGMNTLESITADLQEVAQLNAFCAWVREAIKEKEAQSKAINQFMIDEWVDLMNITRPIQPKAPKAPRLVTEADVIASWNVDKRNKYLRLEAFAATLGKYIHPEGAYSVARKDAHKAVNKPITKEGAGRDMVLYYTEPSVPITEVDSLFMSLQETYRNYEKDLNQMKAEIKETVNKLNQELYDQHLIDSSTYTNQCREYDTMWADIRTKFLAWRANELERISKLKIVIPNALKPVFDRVKDLGNISE